MLAVELPKSFCANCELKVVIAILTPSVTEVTATRSTPRTISEVYATLHEVQNDVIACYATSHYEYSF